MEKIKRGKKFIIEHKIDIDESLSFVGCPECSSKPGTPVLCKPCLHNRLAIERFRSFWGLAKRDFNELRGQLAAEREKSKRLEEFINNPVAIHTHILRNWPKDKIRSFALHLLGQEWQELEAELEQVRAALIEHRMDLHQYSTRPCPTCRQSAEALGITGKVPYTCAKREYDEKALRGGENDG